MNKERAISLFVRTGVLFVAAASAWAGMLMSGMQPGWALLCSMVGGTMAMFAGMVMSGVKYHSDIEAIAARHGADMRELQGDCAAKLTADVEVLRQGVVAQRKEMAVAAVAMTKKVAEGVAEKVVARYVKNLPTPEHVESAVAEANDIVNAEIAAYGEAVRRARQPEHVDQVE